MLAFGRSEPARGLSPGPDGPGAEVKAPILVYSKAGSGKNQRARKLGQWSFASHKSEIYRTKTLKAALWQCVAPRSNGHCFLLFTQP